MINAKKELVEHIKDREVKYVFIEYIEHTKREKKTIRGLLQEVLPLLDFEYDDCFGIQKLYGYIWYTDGTWSERFDNSGAEWWVHKKCPVIPE